MKRVSLILAVVFSCVVLASYAGAVTSTEILNKVKAAEAGVKDFKADLVMSNTSKKDIAQLGDRYDEILKAEKGSVMYKSPDKIRYDGVAQGIKVSLIFNGYNKLVLSNMIKKRDNIKNAPGKGQDTLDLGFLSSRLWSENYVTVVGTEKDGTVHLKFDPKYGDNDKRHDQVWIQPSTLKMTKRIAHSGDGSVRTKSVYSDHATLGGKLPIATKTTMYDPAGDKLGTVDYKNLKVNTGLSDSLFPTK